MGVTVNWHCRGREFELTSIKVQLHLPSRTPCPSWRRRTPISSCATYRRLTKRPINPVHGRRVAPSLSSTGSLKIWTSSGGSAPLARRRFGYLGRLDAASPMLHHILWTKSRKSPLEHSIWYSTFSAQLRLRRLRLPLPLSAPSSTNSPLVCHSSWRKLSQFSCVLSLTQP